MADRDRDYERELRAVMDAMAESVADTSDEELLEEAREAGDDPVEVADRLRRKLLDQLNSYRRRQLDEARSEYLVRVEEFRKKEYSLPETHAERLDLLSEALSKNPNLEAGVLTAQYRDLEDMSEADVVSALRQLIELGAFDPPPHTDRDSGHES